MKSGLIETLVSASTPRPILERIAAAQLTVDALVAEIRREYVIPAKCKSLLNIGDCGKAAFLARSKILIEKGVIVRKDGAQ